MSDLQPVVSEVRRATIIGTSETGGDALVGNPAMLPNIQNEPKHRRNWAPMLHRACYIITITIRRRLNQLVVSFAISLT